MNAFPVTLDPPFLSPASSRPQVKGLKSLELGERVILGKGKDHALMESFFFFNYYYYLIKNSILTFVLVRKEKEEGRRVNHRIFPWQTGHSPRASYRARWHTVPAAERPRRPGPRAEVSIRAPRALRVESGRRGGFLPGSFLLPPPDSGQGREPAGAPAPRSPR